MLGRLFKSMFTQRAAPRAGIPEALRSYAAGDHATAAHLCEQILAAAPNDVDALCVLALCHTGFGSRAAARDLWKKASELQPAHAEALCALGEPERATGLTRCPGETQDAFEQRLRVACEMVSYWWQQDRLWRHELGRNPAGDLPVWDGGSLVGKRILLHSMRGFGDTINFVRFAAELTQRRATVRLACGPLLHRLLGRCPDIAELVDTEAPEAALKCDVHAPLVVLLKHFFFADLAREHHAYLSPDPASATEWQARLAQTSGLRVGLCWAGDAGNKNDARRSVALATLAPLLRTPGTSWVSLQKGPAASQLALLPECDIRDWTRDLNDFADTAALIAHLDLVVSVNTAVAHLAGALGKPVWVLYSGNEDRRWEVIGDAHQLYPKARLFRQSIPGDWHGPVAAVAAALNAEIEKRQRAPF